MRSRRFSLKNRLPEKGGLFRRRKRDQLPARSSGLIAAAAATASVISATEIAQEQEPDDPVTAGVAAIVATTASIAAQDAIAVSSQG